MSWELVAFAIIILGGVPHGAMDPIIAREAGVFEDSIGKFFFVFTYGFTALLITLVWSYLPFQSLSLFLAISAFHFGRDQKNWSHGIPYGMILLALPSWFWPETVVEIFSILLFGDDPEKIIQTLQILGIIACLYLLTIIQSLPRTFWIDIGIILSLSFLFPPIYYFAIYFVIIHGCRHIKREVRELRIHSFRDAVQTMFLYSTITILAGFAFYIYLLNDVSYRFISYQIIFVGLAAITVPHMIVVEFVNYSRAQRTHAAPLIKKDKF
tara:strand:- start:326 stop:1129 length:804 start_codon:yes stop_codon:yes gene_type:complete